MDYKKKAIDCVKDTVLPIQRAQFEECGCSLDEQYKKYGNTEMLIARVIEPGHIYEIGYPKCVCDEVLSGKVTDVMPDKDIQVEIIHTVLGGADDCRFKVTVS